jgi:hypothetical protein
VGACKKQRNDLERALHADNSRRFVEVFMHKNERSMAEFAAEVVVDTRKRLARAR